MGVVPKDPAGRRDWLERWTAQQVDRGRINQDPAPARWRVWRARLARPWNRARFTKLLHRVADSVLDRELDTTAPALESEHHHPDRVRYLPSSWHVLPRALRYLGVTDEDVFVDFGCGKGRVVHQAAKWPFRQVIGVEISAALAETARANLEVRADQHRCTNVEIVVTDAAAYRVPDDLTIGYLYHPFKDGTLDAVLGRIIDSMDRRPRRVRLIYAYPQGGAAQVVATGRFRVLKEQRSGFLDTQLSQVVIFEAV